MSQPALPFASHQAPATPQFKMDSTDHVQGTHFQAALAAGGSISPYRDASGRKLDPPDHSANNDFRVMYEQIVEKEKTKDVKAKRKTCQIRGLSRQNKLLISELQDRTRENHDKACLLRKATAEAESLKAEVEQLRQNAIDEKALHQSEAESLNADLEQQRQKAFDENALRQYEAESLKAETEQLRQGAANEMVLRQSEANVLRAEIERLRQTAADEKALLESNRDEALRQNAILLEALGSALSEKNEARRQASLTQEKLGKVEIESLSEGDLATGTGERAEAWLTMDPPSPLGEMSAEYSTTCGWDQKINFQPFSTDGGTSYVHVGPDYVSMFERGQSNWPAHCAGTNEGLWQPVEFGSLGVSYQEYPNYVM